MSTLFCGDHQAPGHDSDLSVSTRQEPCGGQPSSLQAYSGFVAEKLRQLLDENQAFAVSCERFCCGCCRCTAISRMIALSHIQLLFSCLWLAGLGCWRIPGPRFFSCLPEQRRPVKHGCRLRFHSLACGLLCLHF